MNKPFFLALSCCRFGMPDCHGEAEKRKLVWRCLG